MEIEYSCVFLQQSSSDDKKITLTSATLHPSQSFSVSLFSSKLCSLFPYAISSPCFVHPLHRRPLPPAPLGPWTAELCIFCEGADKQNHSCEHSQFRQFAVSGKKVRLTCTTTADTLPMTPTTSSPKLKKNPCTFCQQSANTSLVFQPVTAVHFLDCIHFLSSGIFHVSVFTDDALLLMLSFTLQTFLKFCDHFLQ